MGSAFIPFSASSGRIVQIQHAYITEVVSGSTQLPDDDTIPQNTEGFEVITCSITPRSAANSLMIIAQINTGYTIAASNKFVALFQDSTAGALASSGSYDYYGQVITLIHKMSAGTVNATTFKIRCGTTSAGTLYINSRLGTTTRCHGGVFRSTLTIVEFMEGSVIPIIGGGGGGGSYIGTTTWNVANTGDLNITTTSFTPSFGIFSCSLTGYANSSYIGFVDQNKNMILPGYLKTDCVVYGSDAGNVFKAVLSTWNGNGCTLTFSKTNSPTGTATIYYGLYE